MAEGTALKAADERRLLVERIAASPHINRSARLRDLLHYLTERVLDGGAEGIREQEVGHKVFGRPADYDTTADNIVRVHASMLRKRLEQYFAAEGAEEPLILEIPKGNYAPVFHGRASAPAPVHHPTATQPPERRTNGMVWLFAATTALFAASTLWLATRTATAPPAPQRPAVSLFWSKLFAPDRATDLVLDDSAVELFQEMTGKPVSLNEYFDRSYLRSLNGDSAATLSRRQSSYANISFLWKLLQNPEASHWKRTLRFARDYSFRDLKANSAILLGNGRTNPWVQPFEARVGIRWQFDKVLGAYFPIDNHDNVKSYRPAQAGDAREGYCSVALLPNLGGTGNVLIVSATGGAAMNAAADFLGDTESLTGLRAKLPGGATSEYPYFEALIRLSGRSGSARRSTVIVARPIR